MVVCEPIPKDGKYKNFGEVLQKLIDVIGQYNNCMTSHNNLVNYLKDQK